MGKKKGKRKEVVFLTNFLQQSPYSQYIIEVYNDAYARTSCVAAAASFLDTERSLTVIRGQTGCQYSPDSSMWAEDPCCNPAVVVSLQFIFFVWHFIFLAHFLTLFPQPLACCAPYSNTVEEYVYSGADLKQLDECGVHDCAESYINDLSDTLNTFTDPITGCASGVLRPEDEMRAVVDGQLDKTLRECALEVGLGDPFRSGFTGVEVRIGKKNHLIPLSLSSFLISFFFSSVLKTLIAPPTSVIAILEPVLSPTTKKLKTIS